MATADLSNFFSSVMVEVVGGLVVAGLLGLLAAPRLKRWFKHRRVKSSRVPRITLLLAKLDGDTPSDSVQQTIWESIGRELRGGVAVVKWPTALKLDDGLREDAETHALRTAHAWLRSKNADLLISGRLKSPTIVSLRFTPAEHDYTEPQTYLLTPEALDVPITFISDLGAAIGTYAAAAVQSAVDSTTYVVPTLRTLSDRLEALLVAAPLRLDVGTIATLNHCCAKARVRLYDFLGDEQDLRASILLNRKALSLRDRNSMAEEWAKSQNNLGACLGRLAERTGVTAYFDEAESALEAALLEPTEGRSFVNNVITRMNLANVLMSRGKRESGNGRLERAVSIFDEIATLKLREENQALYSHVQSNRGIALMRLGERQLGRESLDRSLQAFTEALEARSRDVAPYDWARTKLNLGNALVTLGERTGALPLFQSAVHELKDALEIIKRSRNPRDWAFAQGNLGTALIVVGCESKDEGLLKDAVSALKNALEGIRQDDDPIAWNSIRLNLCRALAFLGELTQSVSLLRQSVTSFRELLDQPSSQSSPRIFQHVLNEYGVALSKLGELDFTYMDEAQSVFEQLRSQLSSLRAPHEWARATFNLGRIQRLKGSEEKNGKLLRQSIDTLSQRFDIFSLESDRVQWAITHLELARSYLALAKLSGANSDLSRCRQECQDALTIFENEPGSSAVADILEILEQVDKIEGTTGQSRLARRAD